MPQDINRRRFIKRAATTGMTLGAGMSVATVFGQSKKKPEAVTAPAVHTDDKTGQRHIMGEGDYQYEVSHDFFKLPGQYQWQTTHNVSVDRSGRVYVIHMGNGKLKPGPTIFVFDATGKFIKAFGEQFHTGGHGLEVRQEGNEEFLYVTTVTGRRVFSKLTLDGQVVWEHRTPMKAREQTGKRGRLYAKGDNKKEKYEWDRRDSFKPTNIAFLDDGEFLVVDGNGAWVIHRFDKDAKYLSTFGERGHHDGQFRLPHGIWVDKRHGLQRIVVADRSNNRLQWFSLEGKHLKTMGGFLLPANCDTQGELLLVPELEARLTLLGPDDKVVARLGDDPEYRKKLLAKNMRLRRESERWQDGKFLHPHDACFDAEGNILVAEWVDGGRVTKLTRL